MCVTHSKANMKEPRVDVWRAIQSSVAFCTLMFQKTRTLHRLYNAQGICVSDAKLICLCSLHVLRSSLLRYLSGIIIQILVSFGKRPGTLRAAHLSYL